jgi:uncharacterized RDD family membrane protein YckC
MIYDGILLFAVLFLAGLLIMPFTRGAVPPGNPFMTAYVLFVCFVFYWGFWTHGGQTLGMKTWRLRVEQPGGRLITRRQAAIRFAGSLLSLLCLGLGYLWILVDRDGRAWHDRLSGTVMWYYPRPKTR